MILSVSSEQTTSTSLPFPNALGKEEAAQVNPPVIYLTLLRRATTSVWSCILSELGKGRPARAVNALPGCLLLRVYASATEISEESRTEVQLS